LPKSGRAIEQLLGPGFQVEPGILVGLVAGNRRDALHEIEDSLCQAPDYLEELARKAWPTRHPTRDHSR